MSAKDEVEKEDPKEDMEEDAPPPAPAPTVPVASTRPDAPVIDHEARARLIAMALAAQASGRWVCLGCESVR